MATPMNQYQNTTELDDLQRPQRKSTRHPYGRDALIVVCTAALTACCTVLVYRYAFHGGDSCNGQSTPSPVVPTPTPVPPTCPGGAHLRNASENQVAREFFRSQVNATEIDQNTYLYSFQPHIAGSSRNTMLAQVTFDRFVSYGFDDVRFQVMPALLMNLTHRSLNRTDPISGATLEELALDEENILNQSAWSTALPPSNGYTGSGRVSGPLVWANYGRIEDFEAISHINLTGTIVVVRYGQIFRGDKVKYAQMRGAVGVVICLDPYDMAQGPVFPNGPWANNVTVQRGSITNNEGDPLTPTWPSEFGGPVLPLSQTFNETVMGAGMALPTIPVQPIGYGNAQRLMIGLGGAPLPLTWNDTGFLSLFQSGIGPGPATAALEVQRDLITYNITNVVAMIEGADEPDRVILMGAHRDAWTYGGVDPISGHSIVLETARSLGKLRETGWRPRRSIQLCSWDAEEWAIIGSTEYVETNVELLRQRAVAYLNLDTAITGTQALSVSGSPLLQHVATTAASEVHIPTGTGGGGAGDTTLLDIMDVFLPIGSGSDHVGFIQLAGVPVLDAGIYNFSEPYEAVYHSNYDSYYWVAHFGDPGFAFHAVMAQYYGTVLLSLSDSNVLPMHVEDYATQLRGWVEDYTREPDNWFADFGFMNASLDILDKATTLRANQRRELEAACVSAPNTVGFQPLRQNNDIAMGMERVFIGRGEKESGMPWYLHVIFTPSATDSYAASTLPLIAEGLASQDAATANFAIGRAAQFIRRAATFVNTSSVMPPSYTNLLRHTQI